MRKGILGLTSTLLFSLIAVTSTSAVEFGQDATGDPNAVHVQGNTSGFLYSERIILTAAHALNQLRIQPNGDTDGFVYAPGLADKTNKKRYRIIKAFIPKTFIDQNPSNKIQAIDDFAVIVIDEDMPMKMQVRVATEEQMNYFADKKMQVQFVGYGLQNNAQRTNSQLEKRSPHRAIGSLLTPSMMINHYRKYETQKPTWWEKVEYGVLGSENSGSSCNGDSGSGLFVEENSTRYYLGSVANGLSMSNCGMYPLGSNNGGPMIWFPPAFKFMNLIENAESFVKEEKQKEFAKAEEVRLAAELKAKQEAEAKVEVEAKAKAEEEAKAKAEAEAKAKAEAEAKAEEEAKAKAEEEAKAKAALSKKTTITCVKGKISKKVTAVKPKCPVGYKKK